MDPAPATSSAGGRDTGQIRNPRSQGRGTDRTGLLLEFGAIAAVLIAGLLLLANLDVSDPTLEVQRSCGSAFDGLVDRAGWETWWARDLDEPDESVRSVLLRTNECPAMANRRLAVSAATGGVGAVLYLLARRRATAARGLGDDDDEADDVGAQLVRLGRRTALAGAGLTAAGAIAIVVLIADADSTLFLYTDRFVVAVIGLIVLIPTMALLVLGRALTIYGHQLRAATRRTLE